MRINLQDPELLRRIAIEEERELQLQRDAMMYRKKVSVPVIDIEKAESELEGEDVALALFSPKTTYVEAAGLVEAVIGEGTSIEQKFTIPTVVCKKKLIVMIDLREMGWLLHFLRLVETLQLVGK